MRDQPCVVIDGENPVQWVCSLNHKARLLGATMGMTKVELDTLSGIRHLRRSEIQERTSKSLLLQCSWTYSPRVEDISANDACILVIDIAGTEKLFGRPETLISSLQDSIRLLTFHCTIAVSPNYHASVFLARSLTDENNITVIRSESIRHSLAHLPIAVLDLEQEQFNLFNIWGIYTLGMLAELPEIELIARLGQQGRRLLQLANGTRGHHFQPVEPALEFEEKIHLDTPVTLLDSLLFVIGVLLDQMISRVIQQVLAIRSLCVTLTLDNQRQYARTITPSLPSNSRALWLKLIHLDIDSHPPDMAILAVHVLAVPGVSSHIQGGLFAPQCPEPARLDITIARIRSIVGETSVGCARLQDSNKPDAFMLTDFNGLPASRQLASVPSAQLGRRQIRPPDILTMTVVDNMPSRFVFRNTMYVVLCAYGPWMISGDWWNPAQRTIEQWDIEASSHESARLYCSLIHQQETNRWLMTALYD
jgi:protein ImuB